ncbi:MAG: outer membrane beta-barrel protein [Candidatus Nitrospinota bacterium M3_3B_026]
MKNLFAAMAAGAILVFLGGAAGAGEVVFSGFVDASYYNNALDETSTFSLDQAELDIEKTIEGAGGLRADIQHLNGDELTGDDVLEQGYMWLDLPAGLAFTFGKFNAPIGWELLDPNDMYQFSHAMAFDYGLPTNLTGAMLSGAFGVVDFSAYAVNGWDLISDDNKDKTIGGRLGVTPAEGLNVGLSYITGKEGSDAGGAEPMGLSVLDVDATFTMIEGLTVGAEFNMGTQEGASAVDAGEDAEWTAYLVTANYAFTDKAALTLRYDAFDDKDGARLGGGVSETRQAFTVSPSYAIADGFGVLAEYRYTSSDEEVFEDADGNPKKESSEFAVEFTYTF